MKKCMSALAVIGAFAVTPVYGDTIAGVYVGAQGWQANPDGGFADSSATADFNFDNDAQGAAYIAVEHPVPFIPNIKVGHTTLDTQGNTQLQSNFTFDGNLYTAQSNVFTSVDLTTTDFILYYELFDNDIVSFDLGVNGKYVDGSLLVNDPASNTQGNADFSGVVPMAYSKVQFGLPFSGLGAYAEGSYLSFDDHTLSDYQLALTYSFIESLALDMTLQLGYRAVEMDIEDLDDVYADMSYDGAFVGLELHF
ncbi:TIGR04219 family outer membrane beta-barrel protein [Salinimonas chungwhensis]|uniref:TIGR04219 family outer membrane beta-barrel protein n=1 Tax=Salinimonas chungwhensis TaxID=265425 RepID=UPI00036F0882|nr:TIGR04219 family outer membrane beta-barrel protein [Salinimonas chungwhensis]